MLCSKSIAGYAATLTDTLDDEARKMKALERFADLDRRGLIEHDWSDVRETGMVRVRNALEKMKPEGSA